MGTPNTDAMLNPEKIHAMAFGISCGATISSAKVIDIEIIVPDKTAVIILATKNTRKVSDKRR